MTTETLEAPQTFADAPPSDRPGAEYKLCSKLIPSRAVLEGLCDDALSIYSALRLAWNHLDYSSDDSKTLNVANSLALIIGAVDDLADKCEAVKNNLDPGAVADALEAGIVRCRAQTCQESCYELSAVLELVTAALKANFSDINSVTLTLEGAAKTASRLSDSFLDMANKFPESAP